MIYENQAIANLRRKIHRLLREQYYQWIEPSGQCVKIHGHNSAGFPSLFTHLGPFERKPPTSVLSTNSILLTIEMHINLPCGSSG